MAKVRILSDQVAHQIAAGEIVERPASVAKELIENSLDAGARTIEVEAEGAGKRRLLVVDNGEGMERDDALLAFEKHATSKIASAQDLLSIHTFGFRGEALGSIGAVARLDLTTRTAQSLEGTRVRLEGGRLLQVEAAGAPVGTRVEVRDLFFNVPARRRFLRSEATELARLTETVTRFGWAQLGVRFKLQHEGRTLLELPPDEPLTARAARLLGSELAGELLELLAERGAIEVRGLISRPGLVRRTRGDVHLFVNRRPVSDRVLLHGLSQAYRAHLPEGSHPIAVLFVELPVEEVDANVHPAKAEVRFRRASDVHDLVEQAVRQRLDMVVARGGVLLVAPPVPSLRAPDPSPLTAAAAREDSPPYQPWSSRSASSPALPDLAAVLYRQPEGGALPVGRGDLVILGQYRNTYILAADARGLLIVDQHVAHERILFERLSNRPSSPQPLLVPRVIELRPAQSPRLGELLAGFAAAGVEAEPFGSASLLIRALPEGFEELDLEAAVAELLAAPGESACGTFSGELRAAAAAALACRGAVKANQALAPQQMSQLLLDLLECQQPLFCPHGRPIFLRLDHGSLERAFGRK
jgi:DNA mismatch repair protein MutL